jgi:menaquinone-dependent protoporphyrinogen IX oxidase
MEVEAQAEAATGRRVLVVYATKYGSTAKVAEAVAEELYAAGCEAEARSVVDAASTAGFDAVVVGGPMILGWHKEAVRFVKARRDALAAVPLAYFITAASLTDDGRDAVNGVPIVKDSWLAKEPGTVMFVVGAEVGAAFEPSGWDTEPLPG